MNQLLRHFGLRSRREGGPKWRRRLALVLVLAFLSESDDVVHVSAGSRAYGFLVDPFGVVLEVACHFVNDLILTIVVVVVEREDLEVGGVGHALCLLS